MPQSILIFHFGPNEEAAQHARHKVEGWKQAFRLGAKLQLKFERAQAEDEAGESGGEKSAAAKKSGVEKSQAKKVAAEKDAEGESKAAEAPAGIRILIRLDFSEHERLSYQRWLDRILAEEPFKSVHAETLRQNDEAFEKTADLFDSLV